VGIDVLVTEFVSYTMELSGKKNGIRQRYFGKQMTKEIKLRISQINRP